MKTMTKKTYVTDLQVRQFHEKRLPKLREGQSYGVFFWNVIPRKVSEKRMLYYKFKGKYLNNKEL